MNAFWAQLNREIEAARKSVRVACHCPDDLMPAAFRAHEEWCRAEIDSLCLSWAQTGWWPQMTAEQAWWVCLRLHGAGMMMAPLQLAQWVEHPSRAQALQWLLVDAWPLRVDALAAKALLAPDELDQENPEPPAQWLG